MMLYIYRYEEIYYNKDTTNTLYTYTLVNNLYIVILVIGAYNIELTHTSISQ